MTPPKRRVKVSCAGAIEQPGRKLHATRGHRSEELGAPWKQGSWTQGRGDLLHRRKLPQTRSAYPPILGRGPARTRQPLHPKPGSTDPGSLRCKQGKVTYPPTQTPSTVHLAGRIRGTGHVTQTKMLT